MCEAANMARRLDWQPETYPRCLSDCIAGWVVVPTDSTAGMVIVMTVCQENKVLRYSGLSKVSGSVSELYLEESNEPDGQPIDQRRSPSPQQPRNRVLAQQSR